MRRKLAIKMFLKVDETYGMRTGQHMIASLESYSRVYDLLVLLIYREVHIEVRGD